MDIFDYYFRKDILKHLVNISKGREIQVWFGDIRGRRPDSVNFEEDVREFIKKGMTSFHVSEERWNNPLLLRPGMLKRELDELRKGWDMIIDIDCKDFEYSKITAELIIDALKFHDVKNISLKFSVTGDTPVLIKDDVNTRLTPLSEAIKLYKLNKKLKVLSLDKDNCLKFLDISGSLSHKDRIYNIYHEQSGLPLKATGHHSVFCWSKGETIQKKVSELKKGDYLISFISSNNIDYTNKKIVFNQFIYLNNPKKISIKITKDLMRLIGYYLAEGHATKINYMVGFSFNKNEKIYINDVKNLIKALPGFNSTIRDAYPNKGAHQVIIHSKEWFSFFNDFCGIKDNKHIPNFVWNLSTDYFLELLLGYIRGDAHKKSPRYLTIKSVSHRLTAELIWLCKLQGISCNLYEEFNKLHRLPQGNWFKGSHIFMIKILKAEFPLAEHNTKRNKFTAYPTSRTFPIDGLKEIYYIIKPGKFLNHRNEQMTLSKKRANLNRISKVIEWFENYHYLPINSYCKNIIQKYKDLKKQDICVLKVRKVVQKLKKEKVYDISVKNMERFFGGYYPILLHNSGNTGFHIGVPFEAFPKEANNENIKNLFPDGLRVVASYISDMILEYLRQEILKRDNINDVCKKFNIRKEAIVDFVCEACGNNVEEKTGSFEFVCLYCENKLNSEKNFEVCKCGKIMTRVSKNVNTKCVCGGKKLREIFNPYSVVGLDTVLISNRHLFRAPYSINEKSGFVSVPLRLEELKNFKREDATIEKVKTDLIFLDRENVVEGSASRLITQAFDWFNEKENAKKKFKVNEKKSDKTNFPQDVKITQKEFFPPCINLLFNGLKEDGRKRGVFVMIIFLRQMKWDFDEIEKFFDKWNKKNYEPLREGYIKSQISWFKRQESLTLPPNCDNKAYYQAMGVCRPDNLCKIIKNPVNYAIRKSKILMKK